MEDKSAGIAPCNQCGKFSCAVVTNGAFCTARNEFYTPETNRRHLSTSEESPAKREARSLLDKGEILLLDSPGYNLQDLEIHFTVINEPTLAAKVRDARRMIQGALDSLSDKAELPRIKWGDNE